MKTYNPTTPARRKANIENHLLLTKKKPERRLVIRLKKSGGRSGNGRITSRHRGGGMRKKYRIVSFGQGKINVPAEVIALEYDPMRTAFLALLRYADGQSRYILAPHNLKVGDNVITSEKTEIKPANRLKLENIPEGTMIHNIELEPGKGGKIVRSAGAYATVMSHAEGYTHLKLPSSEIRKVLSRCYASVGVVSNVEHRFVRLGKAGRSRNKGRRPKVRGSAMNPCDHPHGGGEGRSPIGLKYPKTPWGKPALGVKTRKRIHTNKFIIKKRKKK